MILHSSFLFPVMPSETPVSYASRIAFSLGCSLRALCSRTDIPRQNLLEGDPSAIAQLCSLCQLPDGTFADTTFVTEGAWRSVAGQILFADQVQRDTLRVCPACVEEQLAAGRGFHEICSPREWSVIPLHVCPTHSVPMLSVSGSPNDRFRSDFAARLQDASQQGLLRTDISETVRESGLGHHIRDRLAGSPVDHWLSRLPLYAAIKTAQLIGSATTRGVRKTVADLNATDRFEAGRVGYDILSGGEAGLREFFSECQRNSHAEANTAGLKFTFGRIYSLLSEGGDAAYDPLRDVLRRHIVETMPFGPGDTVLGKEVTERRVHSARTVAPELGVTIPTAYKRLRFAGVLGPASEEVLMSQRTFDATVHANDIRRLTGALQRADAARYLGLKRQEETPILDMVGSLNVDKSRKIDQLFAKEDLDAFLALILGKASSGPSMSGFEPIGKISKRTQTAVADMLDMIHKGEITDIRVSTSHSGILSLMVRKDDIVRALVARRPWVPIAVGTKILGIREDTLSVMVRNKIIPSEGISPVRLKPEDLEAFKRTYIGRREATRRYSKMRGPGNRPSITKAIAAAGLEPAFDPSKTVSIFYRWDEVLACLGPPPV